MGVDVSKHHLDWVAGERGEVARELNTPVGVRRLVSKLQRLDVALVVFESTGGYERKLAEKLDEAGLPVSLVNPWRVRRFGEGLGVLAKTDPLDACMLAAYGERARPERRPVPGRTQRLLADLVRRRRQLMAMIVAEKNRLDLATAVVRADVRSMIRLLENRVEKIDAKIDAAIEADPERHQTKKRLQSVPSIGPGVARTLIVDLPELGALGRREIASLVGLAPFARDSGRKKGARRIRAGRSGPRTALYLAAMNAARFNPALKPVYERMITAGKPPKVALIAIARKLLTILNAIARDGTSWDEAHV